MPKPAIMIIETYFHDTEQVRKLILLAVTVVDTGFEEWKAVSLVSIRSCADVVGPHGSMIELRFLSLARSH